jgi:Ras-related GTP-binding protein C/D
VKEDGDLNMFDGNSTSIIKLNNQTVLYLREVNSYLALVCILREESFERQGLIDYNFNCFKQAIHELFKETNELQTITNGNCSPTNDSTNHLIDSDQNESFP